MIYQLYPKYIQCNQKARQSTFHGIVIFVCHPPAPIHNFDRLPISGLPASLLPKLLLKTGLWICWQDWIWIRFGVKHLDDLDGLFFQDYECRCRPRNVDLKSVRHTGNQSLQVINRDWSLIQDDHQGWVSFIVKSKTFIYQYTIHLPVFSLSITGTANYCEYAARTKEIRAKRGNTTHEPNLRWRFLSISVCLRHLERRLANCIASQTLQRCIPSHETLDRCIHMMKKWRFKFECCWPKPCDRLCITLHCFVSRRYPSLFGMCNARSLYLSVWIIDVTPHNWPFLSTGKGCKIRGKNGLFSRIVKQILQFK